MKKIRLKTIGLLALLMTTGCTDWFKQYQLFWWPTKKDDRLSQLILHLNSKYRRTIEEDGYSLAYYPDPPKTVLLKLRYDPKKSESRFFKITRAAEDVVKRVAAEDYAMTVSTEIDIAPIQ